MAFAPLVNGQYLVKLWLGGGSASTATDYACEIAEAVITPTAGDENTFVPLCPNKSYKSVGPTEWAMTLNYAQDWASATSLSRFLFDNDGAAFSYELNPLGGPAAVGKPSFTGTGRVVSGPIGGGARGEFGEAEAELPLDGKPTIATTPPTMLMAVEGEEAPAEAPAQAAA